MQQESQGHLTWLAFSELIAPMKKNHINYNNTKVCLLGVIIDAINKTCDIASLIRANDEAL